MLLHSLSSTILALGLFIAGSVSYAQQASEPSIENNTQEILFYLPISRERFPDLIQNIEAALDDAKLDNLKLTTTDYWHPYQQGIRQGRLGIYFAAPHFSSWLVNIHKFEPMLRLSGGLQYVIAARRSDSHIFEVVDLAEKTVCTDATMDLSFLLVRESMTRSVLSAETKRVSNVAFEMGQDNKICDAFSLSEHLFLEFAAQQPFKFIRLQQSSEFSNYAYLLHPGVPPETKRALRKFLVSKKAREILHAMYLLFSKDPRIISAKPSNYPHSQMQSLIGYWGSQKLIAP